MREGSEEQQRKWEYNITGRVEGNKETIYRHPTTSEKSVGDNSTKTTTKKQNKKKQKNKKLTLGTSSAPPEVKSIKHELPTGFIMGLITPLITALMTRAPVSRKIVFSSMKLVSFAHSNIELRRSAASFALQSSSAFSISKSSTCHDINGSPFNTPCDMRESSTGVL